MSNPETMEVVLPDGTVLEGVPVGTTKEQIMDRLSGVKSTPVTAPAAAPIPAQAPVSNSFGGIVKNALGGLGEGAASLPASIIGLMGGGMAALPDAGPATKWTRENIFGPMSEMPAALSGFLSKPKTDAEKWTKSIAEGTGAAVASPGGAVRNAIIGAMSGAGAEAGERVIGGQGGRFLGGMAGGALGGLPLAFVGNKESLAKRALAGIPAKDLDAATLSMISSKGMGVDQTLGQALGRPTNVDALEGALANSEVGRRVQGIFRGQPVQSANAMRDAVGKLPGNVVGNLDSASMSQKGATEVIRNAKANLGAQVAAITPTKGNMTQSEVADMMGYVQSLATPYPQKTAVGDALRDLATRLIDPATKKPHTNIEVLDNVLKDVSNGIKSPGLGVRPMNAREAGLVTNAITDIRGMIGSRYPNFSKGKALFAEGMDSVINPLKEGVVGQIAKRNGFQEGTVTVGDLAHSVFAKGTNPDANVSDILTLQKELTKAGQSDAFLTPAKTYLSNIIASTVKPEGLGGAVPATAQSLNNAFQGSVSQKSGLRDILVGMARAQKQLDDALYPGFEKVMQVVSQVAKRPQRVMGMNEGEILDDSSRNLLSSALRVFSFMPVEKVARNTERLYSEAAMKALDRMVTSPEGVKELQRIARLPAGSKELQTAVATFLASNAASEPKTP